MTTPQAHTVPTSSSATCPTKKKMGKKSTKKDMEKNNIKVIQLNVGICESHLEQIYEIKTIYMKVIQLNIGIAERKPPRTNIQIYKYTII